MAAFSANQRIAHHARSISLPSISHPLTLAVEEQVNRLRASSEATTSSASISQNLSCLKDLYEYVEDLLQLQDSQRTLSNDDSALNGSLALLDICSTTRDVLSQMKQSAQDLQSTFRRRRVVDLNMTNEIGAYMISEKKINKVIRKCLGEIKKTNNKSFYPLLDKDQDQDQVAIAGVLREVEATTLAAFESILSFLSAPKKQSKHSSWSLVSKLIHTKRIACEDEEHTSEVEKVGAALDTLISHKQYKVEDVKNAQKPLEALEISIQDLENGLDCVFRCLIKTRVSLLNILNQ